MNHTYAGTFNDTDWYQVTIDGKRFDHNPSLKVRNHSPDGFAYGYSGSGPAQLALAILLNETDRETAERLYQKFKFDIISGFDRDGGFTLTSAQVKDWLQKHGT
jgi:hypothetical protein